MICDVELRFRSPKLVFLWTFWWIWLWRYQSAGGCDSQSHLAFRLQKFQGRSKGFFGNQLLIFRVIFHGRWRTPKLISLCIGDLKFANDQLSQLWNSKTYFSTFILIVLDFHPSLPILPENQKIKIWHRNPPRKLKRCNKQYSGKN